MNKNLIVLLLASSVLLTIYLMKKNKEKGLEPIKIEIPTKEETPEILDEKPNPIKLSFTERAAIQKIDVYADSVDSKYIRRENLKVSPNFKDNSGNYFSGKFYRNNSGLPILVTKSEIISNEKSPKQVSYLLKDGKAIRRNRSSIKEDSLFVVTEIFDYFEELDTINSITKEREMRNIGSKSITYTHYNNKSTVDTTTQYFKSSESLPMISPQEAVDEIVNATLCRGNFALTIDSLYYGSPPTLGTKTFDGAYSANFEIVKADETYHKIRENGSALKGKIIKIEMDLNIGKARSLKKNYYNGGVIFQ